MKRDKILSVRVNSKLLNKVNELIAENTRCFGNSHIYYDTTLPRKFGFDKVTVADILENALFEFIKEVTSSESNTN